MATFKVKSKKGKYHDENTYRNLVEYVSSSAKVRDGGVIGGSVVPACAADAMKTVTHAYHKDSGLKMRHCILSYGTEENVSFQNAKDMARQIMDYYADDYQIMAAIHEDHESPHIHFLMNTVNYNNGTKYEGKKKDYYRFIRHINETLRPYGLHAEAAKDKEPND